MDPPLTHLPSDLPSHLPSSERRLLSGWGGTPRSAADVSTVRSVAETQRAMASCSDGVIARGLGRSYGDAAQNAGGLVLDMTSFDGLRRLDLEAGTVTASAGMSLDALIRQVLPLGYFVPVSPGTRHVTLGGAIAADIHGKNHHVDGSLQRHLISFQLQTATGETIEVTPESDAELFAATAGGMGLTGVVTEATIRLLPVETDHMLVDTERAENIDDAFERFLSGDERYRYSVAWIDCLATGKSLGRSVLMRANHARLADVPVKHHDRPLAFRGRALATAPEWLPSGLMRRSTIAAFNEVYFRRAPKDERGALVHLAPYFYPLDSIHSWNRGYGPQGFVQYQFVVPYGEEDAIRHVLETLSSRRCPSFVPVLKRFGEGRGMLSFPIPGWTLAVDIAAGFPDLDLLLDGLDEVVVAAGGRVYLAKDARMKPALVAEMYPDLERWREVRARVDPLRRLRSDLARRLELI